MGKHAFVVAVAALSLVGSLGAMDVAKYADLRFAEEYAFSTNREAVIAQLKRDTGPWYFYTLLNLQVAGRIEEAQEFVKATRRDHAAGTQQAWEELTLRQRFLEWDAVRGRDGDSARKSDELLVEGLTHPDLGGIAKPDYVREMPLRPHTYPSALDPAEITYAKFWDQGNLWYGLKDNFAFLAYIPFEGRADRPRADDRLLDKTVAPLSPGFFEAVVEYLKHPDNAFSASRRSFKGLTLAQLKKLQQLFAGDPKKDLGDNGEFVKLVFAKLGASAEEAGDPDAGLGVLERVLAFTDTLPSARDADKTAVMRELLKGYAERGDYLPHRDLLRDFIERTRKDWIPSDARKRWDGSNADCRLVCDYLAEFRRAGVDLGAYASSLPAELIRRLTAETDLLEGREIAAADLAALSDGEYRELMNRVDLKWSRANPAEFAADDDVTLEIDVKNVRQMRIAIYDLDPFEALVKLDGEVRGDLDLDGCVPNVERTVDYSAFKSIRRHRERLALPELKRPGLYVVECSGAGKSSRAVIRKGRLHLGRRCGADGYVFTALDEAGRIAKPSRLQIGTTTYVSDECGEIAVPFAAAGESRRSVVVGSGRLAVRETFDHRAEAYALTLDGVLPQEGVIAGATAKLVLRPTLKVADERTTLGLLTNVTLTVTLTDADGIESVRTMEGFKVEDDQEAVCAFTVPERLSRVDVRLSAEVRNVSRGEDEKVTALKSFSFNTILKADRIGQAILRRAAEGYVLELRGRNGEPLGSRAVKLTLAHRCFAESRAARRFTLQADEQGLVRLGQLADIEKLSLAEPFRREWRLGDDWAAALPNALSAIEGEPIEIAARGILTGSWPGANDIRSRLSLVSLTADGNVVADFTASVSVSNGVVRVAGLPAGGYRLDFAAEARSVSLAVVKPSGDTVEGGLIVGRHRGVVDTGDPKTLRIDSARIADGKLEVVLANATEISRVHVLARRGMPDVTDPSWNAFGTLAGRALDRPKSVSSVVWADNRAQYISERNLGDRLRYILDRRNRPHRPGNMLERPSLLLNPWSEADTLTQELTTRSGEDWALSECLSGASDPDNREVVMSQRGGSCGGVAAQTMVSQNSDFLKNPCEFWTNLRPDSQGRVELRLPEGLEAQDITVIALDGRGADTMTLPADKVRRCAKRDLRFRNRGEQPRHTKAYATVGELYRLMTALSPDDPALAEFAFIARWAKLSEAEKRELYGRYASHELDLFLAFKDRAFFDAVVAPHLRNKRFRQFIDRWLLGEDVMQFAEPGRLQGLNALERCLLAERVPAVAPAVARDFAEFCAAHPVDPDREDRLLMTALDIHSRQSAVPEAESGVQADMGWEPACRIGAASAPWCDHAETPAPVRMKAARVGKAPRRNEPRREDARQLYRPPERTREWTETHYYRRRHADRVEIAVNPFWRDRAAAIAKGEGANFRSESVMYADGGFTEAMAALALTALPLEADGTEIVFGERVVSGADRKEVVVLQRFVDLSGAEPSADGESGLPVKYVTDEFVAGRAYGMLTIVTNPSENRRRVNVAWQLPEGAIPLAGGKAAANETIEVGAYAVARLSVRFYFPVAEPGIGVLKPATAAERDVLLGRGADFACVVVPEVTKVDRTSWAWVSQYGTDEEALGLLKTVNFHAEDVERIGWRMKDAAFRERAFAILDSRGIFNEGLWTTALDGPFAIRDNTLRVRQLLTGGDAVARLKAELGPYFRSSLIELDPEENDLFEHKEYWPLINARAHTLGDTVTIANDGLKGQYRAFLDVLAMKPQLDAGDRLLAAVYLLAQDRFDEAKAMTAGVRPEAVETRMQFDYLSAYFAFCELKPEEGRAIAAKYADCPVARWRERFRAVMAEADEIAGRGPRFEAAAKDAAEISPSLDLVEDGGRLVIRSRNVKKCVVRAYPTDVEMTFSKDPFGESSVKNASTMLRPVWERTLELGGEESAEVALPAELRQGNLIVEARDDEGRVTATRTLLSAALDVQVVEEYGRLRVRDGSGRPVAAAYVKVYARSAEDSRTVFHKDGYTDLRGVFDYAAVSTDSEFKPAEFALLVLHDTAGVRTLKVNAPDARSGKIW